MAIKTEIKMTKKWPSIWRHNGDKIAKKNGNKMAIKMAIKMSKKWRQNGKKMAMKMAKKYEILR